MRNAQGSNNGGTAKQRAKASERLKDGRKLTRVFHFVKRNKTFHKTKPAGPSGNFRRSTGPKSIDKTHRNFGRQNDNALMSSTHPATSDPTASASAHCLAGGQSDLVVSEGGQPSVKLLRQTSRLSELILEFYSTSYLVSVSRSITNEKGN